MEAGLLSNNTGRLLRTRDRGRALTNTTAEVDDHNGARSDERDDVVEIRLERVLHPYERPKLVWRTHGVLHGLRVMDGCRKESRFGKQTSKETRREDGHLWQLHGAPTHPDMCLLHGFLLLLLRI